MTLALIVVLFTGLCLGVEVLARLVRLSPELLRKLAHMSAAVLAAGLPLVLSFAEIAGLGVAFAALMALSLRVGIFRAIHGVSRTTYGEIFFPLGLAALAVVCPSPLPFAFGVLVLGICDGLAALVGGRFGRRAVPIVQTRKTLWGTGTFLVACFCLGVAAISPTGVSASYAFAAATTMALALTPVELFLTYGLDNLVLPTVAGSLLTAL
jgi:phytol kinase